MKWTKNKGFMVIFVVLLLVASFIWGGNHPKNRTIDKPVATQEDPAQTPTVAPSSEEKKVPDAEKTAVNKSPEQKVLSDQKSDGKTPDASSEEAKKETGQEGAKEIKQEGKKETKVKEKKKPEQKKEQDTVKMEINPKTGKDKYLTEPVPEGRPLPVEWQDVTIDEDAQYHCTLSVSCKTILDNMDLLDKSKLEVLPKDGIIYAEKEVIFYDGESVFNVLQREMKKNKIHLEFEMTPVYNSNYIEGINNLYEFDCGELSGWMYKVNGWFPNYGSSRYRLRDGDRIEWVYTCDLGRDVGDNYIGNAKGGGD